MTMRAPVRFEKWEGLGNDFALFRADEADMRPELARRLCDRRFGIGGDGVILIAMDRGRPRMIVYNADGSRPEMCGNGLRCVAKYVYDHGIKRAESLRIQTGRGTLTVNVEIAGGKVHRVEVNMDQPILEAGKIPVKVAGLKETDRVVDVPIVASMKALSPDFDLDTQVMTMLKDATIEDRMTCVSMGNPHMIAFGKNVLEQAPETRFGPLFEGAPMFPRRINVHFVQVHSPEEVTMRTWERGSGVTLACGTGACAVCVAGALSGRSHRRIKAHLPGGDLELEWRESDNCVYMTGPATEVFTGDWPE